MAVLWSAAWTAGAQAPTPATTLSTTPPPRIDLGGAEPSAEASRVARWAFASRDTAGRPFAVVDKTQARIFVFAARGRLVGSAPALLGSAFGDDSAPGVGQRVLSGIPAAERTTPAGRFDSEPGHNHLGEAVVWVSYDAAVAIHRLRPGNPAERRAQRLATPTPADNRISLGCIVVAEDFYDRVVAPTLGRSRGVVYVLPETRDLGRTFGWTGADL